MRLSNYFVETAKALVAVRGKQEELTAELIRACSRTRAKNLWLVDEILRSAEGQKRVRIDLHPEIGAQLIWF